MKKESECVCVLCVPEIRSEKSRWEQNQDLSYLQWWDYSDNFKSLLQSSIHKELL